MIVVKYVIATRKGELAMRSLKQNRLRTSQAKLFENPPFGNEGDFLNPKASERAPFSHTKGGTA